MSDPIAELDGLLLDLKLKAKGKPDSSSSSSSSSSSYASSAPKSSAPSYSSPSYSSPSYSTPSSTSSSVTRGPTTTQTTNLSLADQESALFRELNSVRSNPNEYAAILERERRPYFEGKMLKKPNSKIALITEEGISAVDEAIRTLRATHTLPEFTVSYGLTLAAREAVRDLNSSDDRIDSVHRLAKYGDFEEQAVEIATFSRPPFDAREAVLRLLIGDGQPLREHRGYILSPTFKVVGVAVRELPSGTETMVCLINFTKRFVDRT